MNSRERLIRISRGGAGGLSNKTGGSKTEASSWELSCWRRTKSTLPILPIRSMIWRSGAPLRTPNRCCHWSVPTLSATFLKSNLACWKGKFMELDKLSLEFERALEDARHFAERRGEAFITPIHLLHVMLDTGGVLAAMGDKQSLNRARALDLLLTKASEERAAKLAP